MRTSPLSTFQAHALQASCLHVRIPRNRAKMICGVTLNRHSTLVRPVRTLGPKLQSRKTNPHSIPINPHGSFRKLGVPCFGVLILLFRVLNQGPLFSETPTRPTKTRQVPFAGRGQRPFRRAWPLLRAALTRPQRLS